MYNSFKIKSFVKFGNLVHHGATANPLMLPIFFHVLVYYHYIPLYTIVSSHFLPSKIYIFPINILPVINYYCVW